MEEVRKLTVEGANDLLSKPSSESLLLQTIGKDVETTFPTEAAEIWREKYQESKALIDHYRAQVDFLTQQLSISVDLAPTSGSTTDDLRTDHHGNVLQLLRSSVTTAKQEEEITRLISIVCGLRNEVLKSKTLEEELRLRLSKITEAVEHRDEVIQAFEQKTKTTFEKEMTPEMRQQSETKEEIGKWETAFSELKDQLMLKDEEIARKTILLAESEEKIRSLVKERKERGEKKKPVQEILHNSKVKLKIAKEAKDKVGNELEFEREKTKELEVAIKTLKQKVRVSNAEKTNNKLKNSQNIQNMMEEVATLQNMVASLRRDRPVVDPVDQEKLNLEKFNQTIQLELENQIKINLDLEENLKCLLEITKKQEAQLKQQSDISVKEQTRSSILADENQSLNQQIKTFKLHIQKSEIAEETIREDLQSVLKVAEEKQLLTQKLKEAKGEADSQIKTLNQQLASLRKDYDMMSSKLENVTSESTMPIPELTVLKESRGNLRQHTILATKESTKTATKFMKVKTKNELQVDEISRRIIQRLETEKSTLAKDVEKLHKLLKFHKKSDKDVQEELQKSKLTRLDNTKKEKELATLQAKLENELEEKESYKNELEELKETLIEQEAEKRNLKAMIDADKAKAEKRLDAKVFELREEVKKLHKLLSVERISNEDVVKSYEELKRKTDITKLENIKKQKELANLQAKLKKEFGENENYKIELVQLKTKLIEQETEKSNLKAMIEADKAEAEQRLDAKVFELREEVKTLHKLLRVERMSNEDAVKSYKELKQKNDVTELDNAKKEKELATLQAKLRKEYEEKESCKIRLEELERKMIEQEAKKENLMAIMDADKADAEKRSNVREAELIKEVENLHKLLILQQKSNKNLEKAFDEVQEETKLFKLNAVWEEKELATLQAKLRKEYEEKESCKIRLEELERKMIEQEAKKENLMAIMDADKADAEKRSNVREAELIKEVENLHKLLILQQKSNKNLEKAFDEVQEETKLFKLNAVWEEKEFSTLEAKIDKKSEENRSFKIELEALKRKLIEQEAEKANLKAMIEVDKAEAEKRIDLEKEVIKNVERLHKQLNVQRTSNDNLEKNYEELKVKVDITKLDNAKKETELAILQAKLHKEFKDKERCKFELEQLNKKLIEQEEETAILVTKIEAENAEAEKRLFAEKVKLQELQVKCRAMESKCGECANLQSMIADKNNKVVTLQTLVDSLQDKIEKKNSMPLMAIEEESFHAWGNEDSKKTTHDMQSLESSQEASKLRNLQETIQKCEEDLECERTKRNIQADNFKRMQTLKDDLLKEKEIKLMEAQERIEDLNRRVTLLQNNEPSVQTDHLLSQTLTRNNMTLICTEDNAYLLDEIALYKEEIKALENQIKDLSMRSTWRQSRDFFAMRITNIKLEFENKRSKHQVERLLKQSKHSSAADDNNGKNCQLCKERLKEIADLDNKVERLQTELSHFDEYFFDEVDDLKYNYAEAVKLNVIYEEQLRDISRRHGISINIRIEELDGKEDERTTENDTKSKAESQDSTSIVKMKDENKEIHPQ